jgi:protein TonB
MGEAAKNVFSSKVEAQQPIRLVREVPLNPGMDAQNNRNKILLFLGASLLLHALTFFSLSLVHENTPLAPPKAVFVDLNALPPQALPEKNEAVRPKQVAESEQAENQSTPKDAKYLGERNQVAEKETKARTVDIFHKGGGAPSKAGNRGQKLSLKDLAPSKAIAPPTKLEMEGYKQAQRKMAKAEAAAPGEQKVDNDGSATNDYLKDVAEGDRTLLSTKEFVYFSYYRRIRQQLEVAWNSRLRSTLEGYMVGGRKLASDRNYVTGVIVILDRYGTITKVQLMERSGATDLDKAAVDAFNAAGPFPDPPSGLVDKNGEIRIPWNFILQS